MYNFISSNLLVSLWKLLRLSTAQSSPNTFRSIRRRQVHTSLIWECSTFSTACATMLWRMPIPIYGRRSSGKMWSSLRPKAYALVLRKHNHIEYLCVCFKNSWDRSRLPAGVKSSGIGCGRVFDCLANIMKHMVIKYNKGLLCIFSRIWLSSNEHHKLMFMDHNLFPTCVENYPFIFPMQRLQWKNAFTKTQ